MNIIPDGFVKVCNIKELKENEGKRFIVDDVDVALFRVKDEIFAVNNLCTHQHAAILHDGFIEDEYITCPAHGWQYNLRTGKMPEGGKGIEVYEVITEKGEVYVKAAKKSINW